MGVSVQIEPRSGAPGWHKGMAQIMELDPGQLRPFQHSAEHVQHAVWGDRPAGGAGEYPGVAPRFLSLCFQNAYRILCQGQSAVGVFRFQGRLLPTSPLIRAICRLTRRSLLPKSMSSHFRQEAPPLTGARWPAPGSVVQICHSLWLPVERTDTISLGAYSSHCVPN